MLLGVALHAALSFVPFAWPVRDVERSDLLVLLIERGANPTAVNGVGR